MTDRRFTAAVVTVSDGVSAGTRQDDGGSEAERLLREMGLDVLERVVVADEVDAIRDELAKLADQKVDLVITTGGTGLGPRDVTPEATNEVIDRPAPGIAELIRASGLAHTPMAALSRGAAGTRRACLIINLAGSPKAVTEGLDAVKPLFPHVLDIIAGRTEH